MFESNLEILIESREKDPETPKNPTGFSECQKAMENFFGVNGPSRKINTSKYVV